MGYEYIPWISDMLDISDGFGSRQLSWNQGLAHLRASSLMNSCWTPSGGFSPYIGCGNGMEFLLNPSFAAWQTSMGISSSPNSCFGNGFNIGNFGNFGNFGFGMNPWQTTPTNPSNGNNPQPGTTEARSKDEFNELKKILTDFANTLSATDKNTLLGNIDAIFKNKDMSWEDKLKELKNELKSLLNDPTNRDAFRKYLMTHHKDKFSINSKLPSAELERLIKYTGFDGDYNSSDVSADTLSAIKNAIDQMQDNGVDLAPIELGNDDVIKVLSAYNTQYKSAGGSLIEHLIEKYNNITDDARKLTATNAYITLANSLKNRAEGIKSRLDATSKANIEKAIEDLNKHVVDGKLADTSRSAADFNNLYAMVRMAEALVIEQEVDARFGGDFIDDATLKPSAILGLAEATKTDLTAEGITTPTVAVAPVARLNITPRQTTPAEGNPPSVNTGVVSGDQATKEKEFEDNPDNTDCYSKTGRIVDGKTVYKWTDTAPLGTINQNELFVIDNGVPRVLTQTEKRLYGVQVTETEGYTDNTLAGGTKVYIWKGETSTKDGKTVNPGDLCIIEDGVPRRLTAEENTEYGLLTKEETEGSVDGATVYKWTHTKEYNGIRQGDLFIIKDNKPVKLTAEDMNKFWLSVSENKGKFEVTYSEGDSTATLTLYKNNGEAFTVNGVTIGQETYFTVDAEGKIRELTDEEAEQIPLDLLS